MLWGYTSAISWMAAILKNGRHFEKIAWQTSFSEKASYFGHTCQIWCLYHKVNDFSVSRPTNMQLADLSPVAAYFRRHMVTQCNNHKKLLAHIWSQTLYINAIINNVQYQHVLTGRLGCCHTRTNSEEISTQQLPSAATTHASCGQAHSIYDIYQFKINKWNHV